MSYYFYTAKIILVLEYRDSVKQKRNKTLIMCHYYYNNVCLLEQQVNTAVG